MTGGGIDLDQLRDTLARAEAERAGLVPVTTAWLAQALAELTAARRRDMEIPR